MVKFIFFLIVKWVENMANVIITNIEGIFSVPYTKIGKLIYEPDAHPDVEFAAGTIIDWAYGTPDQIIALLNTGVNCMHAFVHTATPGEAIVLDTFENTKIYIFHLTGQCDLIRIYGYITKLQYMQVLCDSCMNLKVARYHPDHFQACIANRIYDTIEIDRDIVHALEGCMVTNLVITRPNQDTIHSLRNVNIPVIRLGYCTGGCVIDPILENPNIRSLYMVNQPIITTGQCHLLEFICRYQNEFIDQRIAENIANQH